MTSTAKLKPDKTRYSKNPLRSPAQKRLSEVFGDCPVIDAKMPLTLFPQDDDFEKASKLDPHGCGFFRCSQRQCGSTAALVFHRTAYFDFIDSDGVRRIHKYVNSPMVMLEIDNFDNGKPVDTHKSFTFLSPSKSQTIAAQRAKGKRLRTNPRSRKLLEEWTIRSKLRRTEGDLENQEARLAKLMSKVNPTSPTLRETEKQVRRLKSELKELRIEWREKLSETKKLRKRAYKPKRTIGKSSLNVRNGTGYMTKLRIAA